MATINIKSTKEEQRKAMESYDAYAAMIEKLESDYPEIEVEETGDKLKLPLGALKLLGDILKMMGKGEAFSLVPSAAEVTTQKAAEILGCSRPHLVKLLQNGEIPFTKVGKHRRILIEDVNTYKRKMKEKQKQHIIDMMRSDEELGLYDS